MERLLAALRQPAALLDDVGHVLAMNDTMADLLHATGDVRGQPFAGTFLDATERGGFHEVLGFAVEGHVWTGRLHFPAIGADAVRVDVTGVRGDGGVPRALVVVQKPDAGDELEDLAERLGRLARVTADLLYAADLSDVTELVVQHMADAAGATTASLSLCVDDDTLALVGIRGGTPNAAAQFATFPADETTPAGAAALTGEIVLLVGRDQIVDRFPGLGLAAEGERSMLCVPLKAGTRRVGVVGLSFPYKKSFGPAELTFFRLLGDTCAQAVERIRAEADAEDQALKLRFLAAASAELASSLDYEETLARIAWLAVPEFADWASVSLEEGGVLRHLAVAHTDRSKLAIVDDLLRRYPPDPQSPRGSYEVLRTGQSLLTPQVTDDQLVAAARNDEELQMLRALGFTSGLVVPLRARGRVVGTLSWVSGEGGRRFTQADVAFGEDLARRAGIAIENSQLMSELRTVSELLQDAVRPADLPARLAGWELAGIYRAAGGMRVGGDFYEVVAVDADRLAVVVGDVMGRGIPAASAMAEVRSGVRTLVAIDPDPAAVMAGLDRLYEQFPTDQLVTLAYALCDRSTGTLAVTSAGHPAPLVVRATGEAEFLDEARGMILGITPRERPVVTTRFAEGDALILFTDGLVERRTEDLEIGKGRLLQEARAAVCDVSLSDALAKLVTVAPDDEDDVALLAVRRLSS
ncbi:MAG TPA: SpoIIE family protein phosphatase [Nocardioidaceae bacterium]|nr:SpoIIE family protein phosphatase [Nocardioidaceae bacterium]